MRTEVVARLTTMVMPQIGTRNLRVPHSPTPIMAVGTSDTTTTAAYHCHMAFGTPLVSAYANANGARITAAL
jgi:hypothetical protein